MKPMALVGVILVVLGIVALVFQYVPIRETRTVIDAGPIQVQQERERHIPIPTIAGVIAVIAGLGLAIASQRRA
jgi:hypothetical protein